MMKLVKASDVGTPSTPKRHHYVPQCHLDLFAKQSQNGKKAGFYVYDKDQEEPRWQTPTNTTVIGHLYTLPNDACPDGHFGVTFFKG